MENLYMEIDRITAKEGSQGGLTAGQQAQVDRNRARIEEMKARIETIENSIRQK